MRRLWLWSASAVLPALSVALLAHAAGSSDASKPGGDTTVFATGFNAFSMPAANLDEAGRTRFAIRNSFFRRNWVSAPSSTSARDGLGPQFNARSCGACHQQGGRGSPPLERRAASSQPVALVLRLSVPGEGQHGGPKPEPTYGDQFRNATVQGVRANGKVVVTYRQTRKRFLDGDTYSLRTPIYEFRELAYGPLDSQVMVSPRIAAQLIGVGLIEAIPEEDILDNARQQKQREDAIKGVPNRVWDVFAGGRVIGRFGWKANVGSLAHQTAAAFQSDIGITSHFFPNESCTRTQADCLAAPHGNKGSGSEIDDQTLADVVFNQATLAPPARRNSDTGQVARGEQLFHGAQCHACHRPTYVTGETAPNFSSPALHGQTIYPYTDLLLHDMGPALADGRPDFEATGTQWRTPPLWGIGLIPDVNHHNFLLHDGRARGVLEAILWHGGEAEESKRKVLRMSRKDRLSLVKFVESL